MNPWRRHFTDTLGEIVGPAIVSAFFVGFILGAFLLIGEWLWRIG
jgi:hypothetical protein